MILNMQNPETLITTQLITETRVITPSSPTTDTIYNVEDGVDGYTKVTVKGSATLLASNIRENTTIFGVRGSYRCS